MRIRYRLLLVLGFGAMLLASALIALEAPCGILKVSAHIDSQSDLSASVVLTVTGPLTVVQGHPTWFTATVAPPTVTLPLTYTWQATGQTPQTHTLQATQDVLSFTWDVTGTQHVTVTASNGLSLPVNATHTLTVEPPPPPQAVTSVTVTGPMTSTQGLPAWFTATVAPPTATLPITYTWRATAQTPQTHILQATQDVLSFTWDVTGTQHVTVTASNGLSLPVNATHTLTVEPPPPPQAVTSVTVTGVLTAVQRSLTWFTATVAPPTVTLPLTYTWQATGQPSRTHALAFDTQDVISFTWDVTGTQHVTVTASNGLSLPVQAAHTLTVEAAPPTYVYLPLVLNQYPEIKVCDPIPGQDYQAISVLTDWSLPPNPSAAEDPRFNVNLLEYRPVLEAKQLIDYGPSMDPNTPKFYYLFDPPIVPVFSEVYMLYHNGNPTSSFPVSFLGLRAEPGQIIRVPDRPVKIDSRGYKVLVLYASQESITLTYTRFDGLRGENPDTGEWVGAYVVHIDGICVEPSLQALYEEKDDAGRFELPALKGRQPFGRAWGSEIRIAIRDTGTLLDPRSRYDWWE